MCVCNKLAFLAVTNPVGKQLSSEVFSHLGMGAIATARLKVPVEADRRPARHLSRGAAAARGSTLPATLWTVKAHSAEPTVGEWPRSQAVALTLRGLARREEGRKLASETITKKLAADGIVVKEVMMRDVTLPEEYARGLEGLLLKEQENDRMSVETEIQQKQVRIAELQAEAAKVREVKRAEGSAQVRVLRAKGESDAMQYTLPLKQKQIQQTRLEAEARKESTLQSAEAAAQAKVIDSKAELERRKLMAEAEANRIRLTAAANAERMKSEAVALRQNPLLINKIIAERLSDKVQIMMVPTDGKFFLTNDLLRGAPMPATSAPRDPYDPPESADGYAHPASRPGRP